MSSFLSKQTANLIKFNRQSILLNELTSIRKSKVKLDESTRCLIRAYSDKSTEPVDGKHVKEFKLDEEWHDVYSTKSKQESNSLDEHAVVEEQPKFTKLLRNSGLIKKGYIKNGFFTTGTITDLVNDTIFIDYGGKFQYITQRPKQDREFYVRGAQVKIKVLDWELTARFIGSDTDATLCESEAKILQLISSPYKADISKRENDENIDKYLKNLEASIDKSTEASAQDESVQTKDQVESLKEAKDQVESSKDTQS